MLNHGSILLTRANITNTNLNSIHMISNHNNTAINSNAGNGSNYMTSRNIYTVTPHHSIDVIKCMAVYKDVLVIGNNKGAIYFYGIQHLSSSSLLSPLSLSWKLHTKLLLSMIPSPSYRELNVPLSCVAFSCCGKYLAVGTWRGAVIIFVLINNHQLVYLMSHHRHDGDEITALIWSTIPTSLSSEATSQSSLAIPILYSGCAGGNVYELVCQTTSNTSSGSNQASDRHHYDSSSCSEESTEQSSIEIPTISPVITLVYKSSREVSHINCSAMHDGKCGWMNVVIVTSGCNVYLFHLPISNQFAPKFRHIYPTSAPSSVPSSSASGFQRNNYSRNSYRGTSELCNVACTILNSSSEGAMIAKNIVIVHWKLSDSDTKTGFVEILLCSVSGSVHHTHKLEFWEAQLEKPDIDVDNDEKLDHEQEFLASKSREVGNAGGGQKIGTGITMKEESSLSDALSTSMSGLLSFVTGTVPSTNNTLPSSGSALSVLTKTLVDSAKSFVDLGSATNTEAATNRLPVILTDFCRGFQSLHQMTDQQYKHVLLAHTMRKSVVLIDLESMTIRSLGNLGTDVASVVVSGSKVFVMRECIGRNVDTIDLLQIISPAIVSPRRNVGPHRLLLSAKIQEHFTELKRRWLERYTRKKLNSTLSIRTRAIREDIATDDEYADLPPSLEIPLHSMNALEAGDHSTSTPLVSFDTIASQEGSIADLNHRFDQVEQELVASLRAADLDLEKQIFSPDGDDGLNFLNLDSIEAVGALTDMATMHATRSLDAMVNQGLVLNSTGAAVPSSKKAIEQLIQLQTVVDASVSAIDVERAKSLHQFLEQSNPVTVCEFPQTGSGFADLDELMSTVENELMWSQQLLEGINIPLQLPSRNQSRMILLDSEESPESAPCENDDSNGNCFQSERWYESILQEVDILIENSRLLLPPELGSNDVIFNTSTSIQPIHQITVEIDTQTIPTSVESQAKVVDRSITAIENIDSSAEDAALDMSTFGLFHDVEDCVDDSGSIDEDTEELLSFQPSNVDCASSQIQFHQEVKWGQDSIPVLPELDHCDDNSTLGDQNEFEASWLVDTDASWLESVWQITGQDAGSSTASLSKKNQYDPEMEFYRTMCQRYSRHIRPLTVTIPSAFASICGPSTDEYVAEAVPIITQLHSIGDLSSFVTDLSSKRKLGELPPSYSRTNVRRLASIGNLSPEMWMEELVKPIAMKGCYNVTLEASNGTGLVVEFQESGLPVVVGFRPISKPELWPSFSRESQEGIDCPAVRCGAIEKGDILVRINDVDLINMHIDKAAECIRRLEVFGEELVKLTLQYGNLSIKSGSIREPPQESRSRASGGAISQSERSIIVAQVREVRNQIDGENNAQDTMNVRLFENSDVHRVQDQLRSRHCYPPLAHVSNTPTNQKFGSDEQLKLIAELCHTRPEHRFLRPAMLGRVSMLRDQFLVNRRNGPTFFPMIISNIDNLKRELLESFAKHPARLHRIELRSDQSASAIAVNSPKRQVFITDETLPNKQFSFIVSPKPCLRSEHSNPFADSDESSTSGGSDTAQETLFSLTPLLDSCCLVDLKSGAVPLPRPIPVSGDQSELVLDRLPFIFSEISPYCDVLSDFESNVVSEIDRQRQLFSFASKLNKIKAVVTTGDVGLNDRRTYELQKDIDKDAICRLPDKILTCYIFEFFKDHVEIVRSKQTMETVLKAWITIVHSVEDIGRDRIWLSKSQAHAIAVASTSFQDGKDYRHFVQVVSDLLMLYFILQLCPNRLCLQGTMMTHIQRAGRRVPSKHNDDTVLGVVNNMFSFKSFTDLRLCRLKLLPFELNALQNDDKMFDDITAISECEAEQFIRDFGAYLSLDIVIVCAMKCHYDNCVHMALRLAREDPNFANGCASISSFISSYGPTSLRMQSRQGRNSIETRNRTKEDVLLTNKAVEEESPSTLSESYFAEHEEVSVAMATVLDSASTDSNSMLNTHVHPVKADLVVEKPISLMPEIRVVINTVTTQLPPNNVGTETLQLLFETITKSVGGEYPHIFSVLVSSLSMLFKRWDDAAVVICAWLYPFLTPRGVALALFGAESSTLVGLSPISRLIIKSFEPNQVGHEGGPNELMITITSYVQDVIMTTNKLAESKQSIQDNLEDNDERNSDASFGKVDNSWFSACILKYYLYLHYLFTCIPLMQEKVFSEQALLRITPSLAQLAIEYFFLWQELIKMPRYLNSKIVQPSVDVLIAFGDQLILYFATHCFESKQFSTFLDIQELFWNRFGKRLDCSQCETETIQDSFRRKCDHTKRSCTNKDLKLSTENEIESSMLALLKHYIRLVNQASISSSDPQSELLIRAIKIVVRYSWNYCHLDIPKDAGSDSNRRVLIHRLASILDEVLFGICSPLIEALTNIDLTKELRLDEEILERPNIRCVLEQISFSIWMELKHCIQSLLTSQDEFSAETLGVMQSFAGQIALKMQFLRLFAGDDICNQILDNTKISLD